MLTVSGLANEVQVSADTVRHYVKVGLLKPRRHADNNYKLFEKRDIRKIRLIIKAKSLGFTLKEIAEIVDHCGDSENLYLRVHEMLFQHVEDNRDRLRDMIALQQRMELALQKWADMSDEISFDLLIEKVLSECCDD